MAQMTEQRIVSLSNNTNGKLYHLNYPQSLPQNTDFTQHLVTTLGNVISMEFLGVKFGKDQCDDDTSLEV